MTGASGEVYRVEWVPGSDHLLGVCFCGAQHLEDDPIVVWEWLYAHPLGHNTAGASPAAPVPTSSEVLA